MRTRLWSAFAVLALCASSAQAAAPPMEQLKATAAALRDKALAGASPAYSVVESLTTEVGPRLAGTPAAKRATDWAVAKLKTLGFQDVRVESFPMTGWTRGIETAEVTAPVPQRLVLTALGGSVATPPEGIEAEITVFPTYQALLDAAPGSLKGKIAVVTQPMVKAQDGGGYGANNAIRRSGPSEAARRGAVAYLHRSLSTDDTRLPHTGALNYQPDAPQIPAASLSTPDAELLDHLASRGKPVRVHVVLTPRLLPGAMGYNVIGELKGREAPDEIVLLGAHLDSWDLGTGAIDDGAGVAIVTGAAKLMDELPRRPRRTIRVVLFGAEEMNFAGPAYAAAHQSEAAKYVVAAEADFGSGRVYQIQVAPGALETPYTKRLAELLAPERVLVSRDPALRSGDDLQFHGVPFIALRQDGTRYFDLHHSADDTLDKIDRGDLDQAVSAWVAMTYLAADSDVDFRATLPPEGSAPATTSAPAPGRAGPPAATPSQPPPVR